MVAVALTEPMPSFTGVLIDDGRLELLNVLGAGAYGTVYRARNRSSLYEKAYYAVKCLHLPPPETSQWRRLSREFELQYKVASHHNILSIHNVTQDDKFVYVVLDLCPGGDLFTAITERQVYHNNAELIRKAFLQLIDAVGHCHENHVYHRDLKPENVLTTTDGSQIWLADFGLATSSGVARDYGCGSAYYMSPECIGAEVKYGQYSTERSDVWSLGIILVNMVTGRNPWRSATTGDKCFSSYMHDQGFLRKVLPISHGAAEILKRIFIINPLQRMTLQELRVEIENLDTFFMSDHDLACASSYLRASAQQYAQQVSTADLPTSSFDFRSPSMSTMASITTEEAYAYPSPNEHSPVIDGTALITSEEAYAYRVEDVHAYRPDELDPFITVSHTSESSVRLEGYQPIPQERPLTPISLASLPSLDITAVRVDSTIMEALSPSNSSSDLSDESEGPITPETHPVDPAIAIPDLEEGEDLDMPLVTMPFQPFVKKPTSFRKRLSKVVRRLRML